jgi:membrane protein
MADLWGYKKEPPLWERRGLAILIVLAFAGPALVLISFGGSILASVYNLLPFQNLPLTDAISLVVAILLDIGLFLILYFLFPHGKSTWRELLPGAIGAGLLWELAKRAFLAFISSYLSASNLIYGSVATVVAFLFWAYLSGLIFLFGAYLNLSAFKRWHQNQDHDAVA